MMSISLVGLTLHVADVERSLSFYKRLPHTSVLFHMPGSLHCCVWAKDDWVCSKTRSGPSTLRLIVRTWTRLVHCSKSQGFRRKVRLRERGEAGMCWWLTQMATW